MSGGAMTQCMGAFPGSVTPRSQPCHQFPNFVWFPISKEHISCSQFSVLNLKAKVSKGWMLQGLSEWGSRKPSKSVCLRQQELQQKKLHTCQTPLQVGDSPHSHPLSSPCAKRLKGVSEKVPFSVGVCRVCWSFFILLFYQIQSGCLSVRVSFISGARQIRQQNGKQSNNQKNHIDLPFVLALKIFQQYGYGRVMVRLTF